MELLEVLLSCHMTNVCVSTVKPVEQSLEKIQLLLCVMQCFSTCYRCYLLSPWHWIIPIKTWMYFAVRWCGYFFVPYSKVFPLTPEPLIQPQT